MSVWGRDVRVKTRDDLLLPNGRKGVTVWDIAALNGNKDVSEQLYCWGTEVHVSFKSDLLPAKTYSILSTWYTALEDGFAQGRNILPVNMQNFVVSSVHLWTLCLPFGRKITGY